MTGSLLFNWVQHSEQSWLFLFNVRSGVHLWLLGQQWTGTDIDRNIFTSDFLKKTFSGNVKESTVFSVQNTPRPKWEIQKFGNC